MVKLVAPNLEKLVVKDREVVYHHVLGMIERSGAKVKHLELNHAYRNDLENIERLITSTFPSLRNLVIDLGCNPSVYRSKSNGILEFLMEKIRPGELGFACLENLQLLVMCRSNPRYNNYNEELLLGLLQGTDAFHRPGLRVELHVYGERSDEYERLGSVLMSSGCAVEEKGRTKGGELLRIFHT
ncbi:hypothetical protein VNI00_007216 [Paramarasmius palmivorus]|uniref:Uncharacterized protein n=1 Tax=Paramarasmius palmivorus TaxID=297713 RepID=A0AAW0D6B4_9AGAR